MKALIFFFSKGSKTMA